MVEENESTWRNWPSDNGGRDLWYGRCYYKCGNQVVDVDEPWEETCELGAWPFDSVWKGDWLDTGSSSVSETTIDNFDFEPKTNTNLVLGCDKDC